MFFLGGTDSINSQSLDIKHLENCFKRKYSFDNSSAIKYQYIYFTVGNIPDTSVMELRLYKNDDSPLSYHISLFKGGTGVFYDGDSLITIYKNGSIKKSEASKSNLNWLKFINSVNPFFDNKKYFDAISTSRIVKQDSSHGKLFITLVSQSKKNKIVYRLNISDTMIVYYEKQNFWKGQLVNLSKSVYLKQRNNCEKDFESIKKLTLSSASRTVDTANNNSKKTFQVGQMFEKWHYTLNGDSINITSIDKSYYLIDLWYIGCKPCMQAIPDLITIANEFDNVGVVGINTMNNDYDYIESYKIKNIINYSFFINQSLGMEYQTTYPCFIILNNKMEILYIENGYDKKRIEKLKVFLMNIEQSCPK
jgi:thiol-disulfide isomerase/thioredoxin